MKSILLSFLLVISAQQEAADSAGAAGHWEGTITLPGTQLGIRVDLQQTDDAGWSGTIDIPVQSLRGFSLGEVTVTGPAVAFAMPGIPGDPRFSGRVAGDGQTMAGDFTQAGQTYPFVLIRKPRPATGSGDTPARGVPGQGLAGHWQGSLKPAPVVELRLVMELSDTGAGQVGGLMISVDQGQARIPITALTESGGQVHLEAESVGGAFDGRLSADGSEIAGDWKQSGQATPLVFKRLDKAPDFSRAQEPKKPYPYEEELVVVDHAAAGCKLAGTLTLPRGAGPHPAVVLITGSGPQDRDEAIMGHRPFFVLADHLTRQGIAVLRYDDRGVGESTGDFGAATHTDFAADALAAVAFLKSRKEIDGSRIGLVGHSEGGVAAPLAAVQSQDVSFIVLLAGVGVPIEQLLVRQAQDIARVMGADEAAISRTRATQLETFAVLKAEPDNAAAEKKLRELARRQMDELTAEQELQLGLSDSVIDSQIRMALSPWFRRLLTCDPRPTLRQVRCPVLALNGEKDLQVAANENLQAIREALAAGGNQRVKTAELPGLNHLFQTCQTGAIAEYAQIEETFNPAALQMVSDWILETVRR